MHNIFPSLIDTTKLKLKILQYFYLQKALYWTEKNWVTFRKQLIAVIWLENPSYHISDQLEINQYFDTYLILLTTV